MSGSPVDTTPKLESGVLPAINISTFGVEMLGADEMTRGSRATATGDAQAPGSLVNASKNNFTRSDVKAPATEFTPRSGMGMGIASSAMSAASSAKLIESEKSEQLSYGKGRPSLSIIFVLLVVPPLIVAVAASVTIKAEMDNKQFDRRATAHVESVGSGVVTALSMRMLAREKAVLEKARDFTQGALQLASSNDQLILITRLFLSVMDTYNASTFGVFAPDAAASTGLNDKKQIIYYNTTYGHCCPTTVESRDPFVPGEVGTCFQLSFATSYLQRAYKMQTSLFDVGKPYWTPVVLANLSTQDTVPYPIAMYVSNATIHYANGTKTRGSVMAAFIFNFPAVLDEIGVPENAYAYIIQESNLIVLGSHNVSGTFEYVVLPERLHRTWYNTSKGPDQGEFDTWSTVGNRIAAATRFQREGFSWVVVVEIDPKIERVSWEVVVAVAAIGIAAAVLAGGLAVRMAKQISAIATDMHAMAHLKFRDIDSMITPAGSSSDQLSGGHGSGAKASASAASLSQVPPSLGNSCVQTANSVAEGDELKCPTPGPAEPVFTFIPQEKKAAVSEVREICSLQTCYQMLRAAMVALTKYIPPWVAFQIMKTGTARIEMTEMPVAVVFVDIEGYETVTAEMTATENERFKAIWFAHFASAMQKKGAFVEYQDTRIMGIFGAPISLTDPRKDACDVMFVARHYVRMVQREMKACGLRNGDMLRPAMGIAFGKAMVGSQGFNDCLHFTACGPVVDEARRYAEYSKTYGLSPLVGSSVVEAAQRNYTVVKVDSLRRACDPLGRTDEIYYIYKENGAAQLKNEDKCCNAVEVLGGIQDDIANGKLNDVYRNINGLVMHHPELHAFHKALVTIQARMYNIIVQEELQRSLVA